MTTLRLPTAGEKAYRGHGAGTTGGGRLVTVERDGTVLGVLRHVVKHSPTGLGWSYSGSGPADLALSLLVDALGPWAMCSTCQGRARVAQRTDDPDGRPEPYDPDRHSPLRAGPGEWAVTGCWDCDQGLNPLLPYQRLKAELVAGLPEQGWLLAQGQLLDWASAQGLPVPRST